MAMEEASKVPPIAQKSIFEWLDSNWCAKSYTSHKLYCGSLEM